MGKPCVDEEDEDEDDDESMSIAWIWGSFTELPSPLLRKKDDDDDDEEEFLSLFLTVEFQKFFISLSVRPGKRAAI